MFCLIGQNCFPRQHLAMMPMRIPLLRYSTWLHLALSQLSTKRPSWLKSFFSKLGRSLFRSCLFYLNTNCARDFLRLVAIIRELDSLNLFCVIEWYLQGRKRPLAILQERWRTSMTGTSGNDLRQVPRYRNRCARRISCISNIGSFCWMFGGSRSFWQLSIGIDQCRTYHCIQ